MTLEQLVIKEEGILHTVGLLKGTMEQRDDDLQNSGVYEEYKSIHLEYLDYADTDIEAMKSALFLQWYALVEPSSYTGINEIDKDAAERVMNLTLDIIRNNLADDELKWMLQHYLEWEYIFEDFEAYENLNNFFADKNHRLPKSIDKELMIKRGQMGKYWCSINFDDAL